MLLPRPRNGETLRGDYLLDTTALFYNGVARVEFEVSGGSLTKTMVYPATYSKYGWNYHWDTTQVANGTYRVRGIAYNAAGKSSSTKVATITVAN
jgi:hypothetical protein